MFLAVLLPIAPLQGIEPIDLSALDAAIERCERSAVLPVFAAEARRRSEVGTAFYQELAEIVAERRATAARRRALREGTATEPATPVAPAASDQELALRQLALDDRQRALDDQRRLETMREDAMDLKRQYFLMHCPAKSS